MKSRIYVFIFLSLLLMGVGNGSAAHSYWIDSNNDLWVKMDVVSGSTDLYVEKTAGYTPSGQNTFEFFDDFSTNRIAADYNEFIASGGAAYPATHTVENGGYHIHVPSAADRGAGLQVKNAFTYPTTSEVTCSYTDRAGRSPPWVHVPIVGYNPLVAFGYFGGVVHGFNPNSPSDNVRISWNDGSATDNILIYRSGTLVHTYSADLGSNHQPAFGLRTAGDERINAYYDDFRVRKYIATPPGISYEAAGSGYKVTVTSGTAVTGLQVNLGNHYGITSMSDSVLVDTYIPPYFNYWVDSNNDLWTKIDVPVGTTELYVEKTAGYTPSGQNTFEFFDDFSTNRIATDYNEFSLGSGYPTTHTVESGGYHIHVPSFADRGAGLKVKNAFSGSTISEVSISYTDRASSRSPPWVLVPTLAYTGNHQFDYGFFDTIRNGFNPNSPADSLKIQWSDGSATNNIVVYRSGSVVHTSSFNFGSEHRPAFGLRTAGSERINAYYDDFRVRKYIATAPTVDYEAAGSGYKVTVTSGTAVTGLQVNLGDHYGITSQSESVLVKTYVPFIPPVASFTAIPTSGNYPLQVQFTDTSTNNPTSWEWDFGDGTPHLYVQNPLHTFNSSGNFEVTLTATNAYGYDEYSSYISVSVPHPPIASFTANPTKGAYPLTVHFTDTSANNPTSWDWDFGDGSPHSYVQNPQHTFTTAGNFPVKLVATNADGYGEYSRQIIVTVPVYGGIIRAEPHETIQFRYHEGVLAHVYIDGVDVGTMTTSYNRAFDAIQIYKVVIGVPVGGAITNPAQYIVYISRPLADDTHAIKRIVSEVSFVSLTDHIVSFNATAVMSDITSVFTPLIGESMFYAIIFALPFLFIWINTRKLTMPTVMFLLFGWLIIGMVPAEYHFLIWVAIAVSFALPFMRLIYQE